VPLASATAAIAPAACTAELLAVPEGYRDTQVDGGDTSGRYLTGTAQRDGSSVPVVWDNGIVMPLSLPATSLAPIANEHGVFAGSHQFAGSNQGTAWVYRNGKFTTLPQPPGGVFYRPVAINNKGQIVGAGPGPTKGQTGQPPLIWGASNTIEAVADRSFMVRGIDDDGTVIGQENFREYPGDLHGLIWRPGKTVTDLPAPPGVGKAAGLSIRDGWVGGAIAHRTPNEAPLKPLIFHLGTGQSIPLPPEVVSVEDVNRRGWAAVNLTGASAGSTKAGLLAEGTLLRLPELAATGPRDSVSVRSISDDGRVISGVIDYNTDVPQTQSVRWLCR